MNSAKFYKVSYEQFQTGMEKEDVKDIYDAIKLPRRATKGSAGYDFYTPIDIHLEPGETVKIPTGIRCEMNERWVLMIYPRSGLGFKYRLQLNNTVGVIDSDYYGNPDNDGHFMFAYYNFFNEDVVIKKGDVIGQVIFQKYLVTDDDNATGMRAGGFGSTDK